MIMSEGRSDGRTESPGSFGQRVAAVRADGAFGIDVAKAVMKGALLRLPPGGNHRTVFGERLRGGVFQRMPRLPSGNGYGQRFRRLLQGDALHRFFQLEPPLLHVLRFLQLTVLRHA